MLRVVYLDDIEVLLRILPLSFYDYLGVAERLSRTLRAESTGLHVEAPKMLWEDLVQDVSGEAMKCTELNMCMGLPIMRSISRIKSSSCHEVTILNPVFRCCEIWGCDNLLLTANEQERRHYKACGCSMSKKNIISSVKDSWNEEPCRDVHQVGDEREVEVLHNFNWPSSELITEDDVLPERGYSQLVGAVALLKGRWFEVYRDYLRRKAVK
ncbi:hypothetical protein Tco_0169307 [Tanacetum coccineum]